MLLAIPLLLALSASPTPLVAQEGSQALASPRSSEWIPFELFRDRWIFLTGRVNGVRTKILLDSGAGTSVMSADEARRRGLRGGRSAVAQGVGGLQEARLYGGVFVEVDGLRLANLTVAAIDMTEVEAHLGRALPFVLGRQVFRDLVVDIDYPNRRVAFHDPETYVYDGAGESVPLVEIGGGWAVELLVEGYGPGRFQLDTGSGETLTLFEGFTQAHGLLDERAPLSTHLAGGVGGFVQVRTGTLDRLSLGATTLRAVPAAFSFEPRGFFRTESLAGNLGAGVLARFRLTLDARNQRLFVEPDGDAATRPFQRDRSGLQTVWTDDGLRVFHVAPGSPAAAAGWTSGAAITAVDGVWVGRDYWSALDGWSTREAGTRIVLRDGEGLERPLVLADYF